MSDIGIMEIGRRVERKMEANGGDRKKAIRRVVKQVADSPDEARDFVQNAGVTVFGDCYRRYRRGQDKSQPEQLTRDSSELDGAMDRTFPVGRSGKWRRAGDCTREDVAEQVSIWRSTVQGLKPRIDAGETLLSIMDDGETLHDVLESGGEDERRTVATYLGVDREGAAAA